MQMKSKWAPSKREVLEAHYNPWGLPCYDYNICEELEAKGLLKEIFLSEPNPNILLRGWVITETGELVVEFIRGDLILIFSYVVE